MNPSPDLSSGTGQPVPDSTQFPAPTHWREALLFLVTTRVGIIRAELHEATSGWIKKLTLLILGGLFLLFAWACLIAGGVAAIAVAYGWAWYWVALAVGGAHLLFALIFVLISQSHQVESFHATKVEFKKDHAWLETLIKKRTSRH